ncbi:MAG: hypothetical protein ACYCSF_03155 [Acidimicrobiales bacterium]
MAVPHETAPGAAGSGRKVRDAPAWQRATRGEHRGQMAVAVAVAIGLQLVVPARLGLEPHWLMPALEATILIALVAVNPGRMVRRSAVLRGFALLLVAAISLANAWSLALLLHGLVSGTAGQRAGPLLMYGGAIWGTNVIAFGIWYWEFDRGGPASRAAGLRPHPDFMFPQQAVTELAPPEWESQFFDYLYTSFTNAAAFSPTDTMPLSRWAKMLFLVQSAISLVTAALVIARAVNILR